VTQVDCVDSLILHGASSSSNLSCDAAVAAASGCLHMSTARRALGKGRAVRGQSKGEIQRTLLMPCNTSR